MGANNKKLNKAIDILDAIGGENEKQGIKWTQHFMDLWDKEQWETNIIRQAEIERNNRFSKKNYFFSLCRLIVDLFDDADVPYGYKYDAKVTANGIMIEIEDRWKRKHHRAFKPSGIPKIDFNYCQQVVGAGVDTIEQLEEKRRTKSGIYLP